MVRVRVGQGLGIGREGSVSPRNLDKGRKTNTKKKADTKVKNKYTHKDKHKRQRSTAIVKGLLLVEVDRVSRHGKKKQT